MSQSPAEPFELKSSEGILIVRVLDSQALVEAKETFYALADRVAEMPKPKLVVLNLAPLQAFPSVMIAMLINFQKKVKEHGGTLKVCNLAPYVLKALSLTRVDKMLDISRDEEEAVGGSHGKGGPGWFSKLFGSK